MADDNRLTGLNLTSGGIPYPVAQPMQMGNPLAQIQQLQGLDLQNQALQQGQANLGENRIRFMQDRLGSLMNKPDLKFEDAQNMVSEAVRNKVIQPQEAPAILQHLPADPVALRAALKQSYASTLDFANRRSLYFGDQTAVNTGGATQFGAVPYGQPGRPQFAGGTSLPNTMSPEASAAPEMVTGPGGQQTQVTRGQALTMKGVNPQTPQLAGAFRQAPAGQGMGVPAPGLGFEENQKALFNDLQSSSGLARTLRPMSQALTLAEKLGATGTGPGTQTFNDVKAFLISNGIAAPNDLVDARNKLDKYLAQTVASSPLSQRSDLSQYLAERSNPNTTTQTNQATIDLLRNNMGMAAMDASTPFAHTGSVGDYLKSKAAFTQGQDQKAYELSLGLMAPDKAKKLLDDMNALPNDNLQKQRFFSSLRNAKRAGLVNLPGATNASGQ